MIKAVQKILQSEIMYYVIIPLAIVVLNWIKNWLDVKGKNKELGYWMKKCKRATTFVDIAMKMYKKLAVIFFVSIFIIFYIFSTTGELLHCIMSGILYFIFGGAVVFQTWRETQTRVEFMTNGKCKKVLILALYFIFGFALFGKMFGNILEIAFLTVLVIWAYFLLKYSDVVFVIEKPYADIYVKGSEKAEYAEAGSIVKQGGWIIVSRYINGFEEEIRIRESDITRIDYYGKPMVFMGKRKLFKRG